MKFSLIFVLSLFLTVSCAKRESISDFPAGPNTSSGKDGSEAGTGSSGSLGSENPGSPGTTDK